MDYEEKARRLRGREDLGLSEGEIIELCFDIVENHQNDIEKCRAAVVLSGIVKPGLGKRTGEFLDKHPDLPERVHEVLKSAIMRMECF